MIQEEKSNATFIDAEGNKLGNYIISQTENIEDFEPDAIGCFISSAITEEYYKPLKKLKALKVKKEEVSLVKNLGIKVYKVNRNFFAVAESFDKTLFATERAFNIDHTIGWKLVK